MNCFAEDVVTQQSWILKRFSYKVKYVKSFLLFCVFFFRTQQFSSLICLIIFIWGCFCFNCRQRPGSGVAVEVRGAVSQQHQFIYFFLFLHNTAVKALEA